MLTPMRIVVRCGAAVLTVALSAPLAACSTGGQTAVTAAQRRAAAAFLEAYVRPDGRVTRPDQGNDTVSEGQAYGLLLAEVAGRDEEFGRIWQWTRGHLQLRNGLFAYHANPAGRVVDSQPASDADMLIAWALLRYSGTGAAVFHTAGRRVAAAVLAHEVTDGPGGTPILAAGPWATGRPASLNPSYWSLPALDSLAMLTGDARWHRLAAGAVTLASRLTQGGRKLPSDWAELTSAGQLRPEPAPNGSEPQTQYGLDAQRTVVWFAASCDPRARALASRWWRLLRPGARAQAQSLRPDGTVLDPAPSVLPLVASAAAAHAAGDTAASRRLLTRAGEQQRKSPTYYGGAWNALAPSLVTVTSALSSC